MFAKGRFAVIGSDVSLSASPAMQNAAFAALSLACSYEARSLREEEVAAFIRSARALGFVGLNVTAPFKERVAAQATWRSAVVNATGAANTLRLTGRGVEAYNTDVEGFTAMLEANAPDARGGTAVLLGAGGAARAASFVLRRWSCSVLVLGRSVTRARELCSSQSMADDNAARWQALQMQSRDDLPAIREAFRDAALVVDAVGVRSADRIRGHEARLPWRELDLRAELLDLGYGDGPSPLSVWSGRACSDGAGMLLHQGAASFRIWTGLEAPLEAMRDALAVRLDRPPTAIPMVQGVLGRWEHAQ